MIFYNNLLAKWFLGIKKHYFMVGGLFFTRYKYLEFLSLPMTYFIGWKKHSVLILYSTGKR